jgi:hypothetical protein
MIWKKKEQSAIISEVISQQVKSLNQTIIMATGKQQKRKAESLKKKLEKESHKISGYERQIEKAGNRSGFNKTDEDATAMLMKNKVEVLPAYNVLGGCEGQFIIGVSVHQNTNDATCFAEHLEQVGKQQPKQVEKIIADSIFGTEQNYELLEKKNIGNLMKYPQYHSENKKKNKENPFIRENFAYDNQSDTYTCPNNQQLILKSTSKQAHKKTGYESTIKIYQCTNCSNCPFYEQCCKSEKGNNRTISINEKLDRYKQQARQNLETEEGEKLRKSRGTEIESCFGDAKHNMEFRRFHLRGMKKVKTEITIVAMAHNLRKVHLERIKRLKNAA